MTELRGESKGDLSSQSSRKKPSSSSKAEKVAFTVLFLSTRGFLPEDNDTFRFARKTIEIGREDR
ncbi:hypothetical protein V1477_008457 [Vespula maculifrons]|uniref:Uncharacterized protein n=1 Tax=Vespula maculifrons TaxID=7453 RepID=A0ABD2CFC5_VESMC